ncbi:MAG: hypothetical protein LQ337_006155 [Flavoplaca oasis]|nr:MAG: hypothetical protein LQ337_006155 [Flavoplaca oasis]
MESLAAKHRQQNRDLQARIIQKKKSATKKTRKGILDECAELERQLQETQDQELANHEGRTKAGEGTDIPNTGTGPILEDSDSHEIGHQAQEPLITAMMPTNEQRKKPNRQKARLARRAAQQEQMMAEATREAQDLPDLRQREIDDMRTLFSSKGLQEHVIRSDGHCLYAAVADQLTIQKQGRLPETPLNDRPGINDHSTPPYKVTRGVTASFIQEHADEFLPFLEEPLDDYVSKIRNTGEWGGHLELLAMAKAYNVDINVLQSSGQIDKIESGTNTTKSTLWLSYYHHNFGLGEHYNSLRQIN